MATEQIDVLLDQVPVLADRHLVEDLPGGLTNRNLKVTTPAGIFVVRASQSDAGLLGIDRDAEHHNTQIAGEASVGAEVVDYRPDLGLLVISFLEATALRNESFTDPDVMTRAADACRRLHAAPRFEGDFDMFTRQQGYLATVKESGFPVPSDYERFTEAFADVRRALAAEPRPVVPCNNDLLAGNYLDDGDRVWLIDYEYSGNNDPCFELGNTSTECEFTPEMTEAWTEAYFGAPTPADHARVRLQALCSEYGWSLWGFIQAASSPIDYDFYGWGMHRYEKAARTFTSRGFARLLEEVAGNA